MTLRHLQIFIQVCEHKSMTAAAREMHISQPSISQAIRELEEHYGVMLFERLGKRLFISPAGQELLTYARHMMELRQQAGAAMAHFREAPPLRLGATLSIGESIFIDILGRLKAQLPKLQLISEVHNTSRLEELLLEDQLDIALVEGQIHSEYLVEEAFLEDELIFIISPAKLPEAGFKLEALGRLPFILREEGSGTRKLLEEKLQAYHIQVQAAGTYNNSSSIKQAVAAGLGVSAISQRLVAKELADGSLAAFQIPELKLLRHFRIVYHRNKYLTPQLQQFIQLCRYYL